MITMHCQFDCQEEIFFQKDTKFSDFKCMFNYRVAHIIFKTLRNLIGAEERQKIDRVDCNQTSNIPVNLFAQEISHPLLMSADLQIASEQQRQRLSSPQKLSISHRLSPHILVQEFSKVLSMHISESLRVSPGTLIPNTRTVLKIKKELI